jgi:4-hydroxy 2-oxovalerate aldolase
MVKLTHMSKKIKTLDCTFRDGGYYNKWDFDSLLVHKYLHAVDAANIDIIELGFRNFPQNKFLGAFAYTTDTYINELDISDHISVGVMIDADSIINSSFLIDEAIDILFQVKEKSRVDLVRIATHFDCVGQCAEIVKALKKLGYQVALNLMQANTKSNDELSEAAKLVHSWGIVDVLYFADSFGSMGGDDVVRVIAALKLNWMGEIGFHAHNNKGLAVSNTLVAIENGATWVDSTILGMGRGAGNAKTENLLLELEERYQLDYRASALFDLVLSNFSPLQNHYHWGESLLYSLAAMHSIHPTYIQEMLADNRYSNKEVLQVVDFMSSLDSSSYNSNLLLQARGNTINKGSWNAKGWCLDKEVLILGSGDSLQTHQQGIIQYIETYKPVVISLNIKPHFPKSFIDVYLSSNESKMLAEYNSYNRLKKPLIISKVLLEKVLNKSVVIKQLRDYGLNIKQDTFIVSELECTLPYELSIGYALSLSNIGGTKGISLVGFDGYGEGDIRQTRMNELLDLYNKQSLLPVISLTPSNYNLTQGSIYAKKL